MKGMASIESIIACNLLRMIHSVLHEALLDACDGHCKNLFNVALL